MKDEMLKLWLASVTLLPREKEYIDEKFETADELYKVLKDGTDDKRYKDKFFKMLNVYEKIYEDNLIEYIKKNNIGLVSRGDKEYPNSLKAYANSPYTFFYKGDINIINSSANLAVIGSRSYSPYGQNVTNMIIGLLKRYNVKLNIVSGMARGIDSIAHRAALENGFATTAVLGSGIDEIYPRENVKLYNDIIDGGGCVISQFPIGTKPLSYNFPVRNSVISGVSDVILVTEGSEKSGTLITVGAALDQGKAVMTVPGSIFYKNSVATNRLVRDGAYIFTEIQDLIDLLNNSLLYKNNSIEISPKLNEEEKILSVLDETPMHIDDIVSATDIDIKQIYKLLFDMQEKKEILCLSGNFYAKINKI